MLKAIQSLHNMFMFDSCFFSLIPFDLLNISLNQGLEDASLIILPMDEWFCV